MGNVIRMPGLRPPVFKIRAEVQVWHESDPEHMSITVLVEEIVIDTPNRNDMEAFAKHKALDCLAKFGVDTRMLNHQFLAVKFFAGQTRAYDGSFLDVEPDWVLATDDLDVKDQAIHDMTYLPFDLAEQIEVYGA